MMLSLAACRLPLTTCRLPLAACHLPLAAGALAFVMLLAVFAHARRIESKMIIMNIILLLLSAFVLYGRL
jgi:hypothetical protein